ncbi:hypothetical protein THRCLA_06334 [Thraustotheca clavata]|uniref:Secreted protein n=1 Tax=Thraustotheca clavata TaxID=74557 RepID=A0A1V9ZPN0_9STRA|nr:hypothetical protein THRCLA_06334 [Thraustotheca clavata]
MKTTLTTLALIAASAHGWWDHLHMTTTQIATQLMPAEELRYVNALLSQWNGDFPNTGEATTSAIWADLVKCDSVVSTYCPSPAHPSDHNQDTWHYTDIPLNVDGSDYQGLTSKDITKLIALSPDGDALNVLPKAFSTFKTTQSVWAANYALRYIIHIFTDLHQPLHASTGISPSMPTGDAGGNFYSLRQPCVATNLHAYWDSGAGNYTINWNPNMTADSTDRQSINAAAKRLISAYQNVTDPASFSQYVSSSYADFNSAMASTGMYGVMATSYDLARLVVYKNIDLTAGGDKKIACPSADYQQKALATIEQQAYFGGARLAVVLTQIGRRIKELGLANPGAC